MGISVSLETKALIMEYDGGIVGGNQKIITRTISRTKNNAEDEKYYSTAETIASLQERDLLGVKKREVSTIVNY